MVGYLDQGLGLLAWPRDKLWQIVVMRDKVPALIDKLKMYKTPDSDGVHIRVLKEREYEIVDLHLT